MDYRYIQDDIESGFFNLSIVPGDSNIAGVFTKSVQYTEKKFSESTSNLLKENDLHR